MKLLHLSDLHIGRSLGDYDLLDDQDFILDRILGVAVERKVDGLLIAGDVYDRAIPGEGAVALFDRFLNKACAAGLKIFLISGNHDSDERLNFGSSLFRANGVYIAAKYDGTLTGVTLTDEYGPVRICLLPFVKASQVRHFFPDRDIPDYDAAVRTALEESSINPEERNVLVAHQFVVAAGSHTAPVLGGSEGPAVQTVGTVEQVGSDCFDAFDYVALGHIHTAQAVGRDTVRYAGSPLKYSLSEVRGTKTVPLVTLGPKGDVTVEEIPLTPRRDVRQLTGAMRQLLDHVTDTQDYVYVTLTDEDIINNTMETFRQFYPYTVQLRYDNRHTRELEHIDLATGSKVRSFADMAADFYRAMYGTDMTDEEMRLLKEAAREAGVDIEAD